MNHKQTFFEYIKALFIQFFKFGIIGAVNTLAYFAIYYGLLFLGVHYIIAHVVGFLITVLSAYYFNRKYVFKPDENKSKTRQLVKVFTVYLSTFLLGTGLMFLQVDIIGISELIAPILNLFVTIPLNFVLNKFWAFR